MKIGIVDADLIGRKKHRFPNLACEKISGYWKGKGAEVTLLTDYDHFDEYDHVFVSKVFTDTPVPDWLRASEKISIGGTGFYFDKAPNLPDEIEHHMPDYSLYDDWIKGEVTRAKAEYAKKGKPFNEKTYMDQFKEYTESSIGFITRGCFRKCKFCVNQKYNRVFKHSPVSEFFDKDRRRICLLDDNFLGSPHWREMLQELIDLKRPFKFKQGLDERLLTDEKCKMLFSSSYDGDFTFAFDNISDYDLIHEKLKMIRRYTQTNNHVGIPIERQLFTVAHEFAHIILHSTTPGMGDVSYNIIRLLEHPVIAPGDCITRMDILYSLREHGIRKIVVLSLLSGHVGQHNSVINLWVFYLQFSQNATYNRIKSALITHIEHIHILVGY